MNFNHLVTKFIIMLFSCSTAVHVCLDSCRYYFCRVIPLFTRPLTNGDALFYVNSYDN